jgi:hypothetical protein
MGPDLHGLYVGLLWFQAKALQRWRLWASFFLIEGIAMEPNALGCLSNWEWQSVF